VASLGALRELRTDRPMPAEPFARAVAKLIDFGIFAGLSLPILAAAALIFGFKEDTEVRTSAEQIARDRAGITHSQDLTTGGAIFAGIGVGIVFLAYVANEAGVESRSGQSIGRRRLGIHVLDARSFAPASWRRRILRFVIGAGPVALCALVAIAGFGTWLGLLGMFLTVGAILAVPGLAFFRDDKRGLHDLATGTRAVHPRHGADVIQPR
jgi:uncharacterized RDD family membrane protein YckC